MNTIFRVAKTELRALFYSPIAWLLIIAFFVQCSMTYFGRLTEITRIQELGGLNAENLENITSLIFRGMSGLFSKLTGTFYLYIPLITMSLISRETSSGTIKLLYSSPIRVRDIVLGKFLAMMLFSLVLLAIIAVFAVTGMMHIDHAERRMLLTGLFGFYLLLCAYSAIGLFMSTLTTYQVIAAITTFLMFGALNFIGELWQRIEFVRDLTYFLSMGGRTGKMLDGLVTTKDVIYFVLIVMLFLGFSILKLKDTMESRPWTVKALRYSALTAIVLVIGYVTSIPRFIGYYDATINKNHTVHPAMQKILKDLGDDPLQVTAYANLVDGTYYNNAHPDRYQLNVERWQPYMRYKHPIQLKTIRYYDSTLGNPFLFALYPGLDLKQIADQHAKKYDTELEEYLTPEQIHAKVDLRPELNRYVMQLEWKGKKAWLRVFDQTGKWPTQTEVAVALRRLQGAKIHKVGFIQDDLERDISRISPTDYKSLTADVAYQHSLINQGFDVEPVTLETNDIPADISVLVLADPKVELTAIAKTRLTQYINNGGNLMVAGEPGRQGLLNPLLKQLGVQLMDGRVIQETLNESSPEEVSTQIFPFTTTFTKHLERCQKIGIPVDMPGASGLVWSDTGAFKIQPLLGSIPDITWNRIKPYDRELMITALKDTTNAEKKDARLAYAKGRRRQLGVITFSPADGDVKGGLFTAVSLTRNVNNKEQRIIVTGDADFANNQILRNYGNLSGNFAFSIGAISWLANGEFPIDYVAADSPDKKVNITLKQIKRLRPYYIWLVPGILLAFGSILLIRRKRK